jgi:polyhydroxyalkanoate synthesis repressor PhaR
MTNEKAPITIKKYANRRLYNTGTSTYVTLEDLAIMVKNGEDFVVYDAKSGDDITRPVLAQIIFEQEGKDGQSLLPITFLRQVIRFYGDSMQMLLPSYLEHSIGNFTNQQQKFRDQMQAAMSSKELPGVQLFGAMEEQARNNMAMFSQAFSMFNPFAAAQAAAKAQGGSATAANVEDGDLDALKKQMADMQAKIDGLARK